MRRTRNTLRQLLDAAALLIAAVTIVLLMIAVAYYLHR